MTLQKVIGYITLYFRIQNDEMTDYARTNFDFSVCPTKKSLENVKNSILEYYKQETRCYDAKIDYCTKEEYELHMGNEPQTELE